MTTDTDTAAGDIATTDRVHQIAIDSEHVRMYQVRNTTRDLEFFCDEPKHLGGKNTGATPLETTLGALNSCSIMIIHVVRREMRFDLKALRVETEAGVETRRAEMQRTGKKYSEIEPLFPTYDKVVQRFYVTTDEPPERLERLKDDVERLCPLQVLFRNAGVPMQTDWIIEAPSA